MSVITLPENATDRKQRLETAAKRVFRGSDIGEPMQEFPILAKWERLQQITRLHRTFPFFGRLGNLMNLERDEMEDLIIINEAWIAYQTATAKTSDEARRIWDSARGQR